ncbi:MAG: 7-alpha-hydroxysteroid dehydrogenase [Frankiales bacterium]|nr:7-alpha-hydroxysteroid dehydrogenase [Frankiales bacterium]
MRRREFLTLCQIVITDRFRVDDKVAIVTGAGRGIGAAAAKALAEAGADVVISSRTEEQLREVAEHIEKVGRRAAIVTADLSDLDATAALATAAKEQFGRLDIVVNNVGGTMPRAFLDTSPRFMEEAFKFNVSTAHALTRAAVPFMLENGGGSVVNITSVMGRISGRGYLAYGTAKGAMSHYTRLAARDLAPRIRVNAIGVGSVATSALDVVLTNDELRTMMEQMTPLKRIGDPEDIAATVLFLASPAGAYVTGKIYDADGGLDMPNLDLGLPDL